MHFSGKHFASGHFSARHFGTLPGKEEIVIPAPPYKQSGGRVYGWDGWADVLKDRMKRKKSDNEAVQMLAMFVTLEDDDAGSIL